MTGRARPIRAYFALVATVVRNRPLRSRPDGDPVEGLPVLRRIMPHLMPTRGGATVYFDQQLDVRTTLAWLEGRDVSLFQLLLWGYVRVLAARPHMHRFVVGRRLYQRRHLELSFAVKKDMDDRAPMTTVKVRFDASDRPADVARRMREAVSVGRGRTATASEREMGIVSRLPRAGLRAVLSGQRALDYFNLLPAKLIENDPLYCSMFLANLGSVGLRAAYHHLYEYGTVPLFGAIGQVHEAPVVDGEGRVVAARVLDVRYTFDERICDGFYAARSLELFKSWIEDPEAAMDLA